MCAGARVVEAVRERARDKGGLFDTIHVRRGGEQPMSMPLFNVIASTYARYCAIYLHRFSIQEDSS